MYIDAVATDRNPTTPDKLKKRCAKIKEIYLIT
jgi:hypothetical protein